MIVFNKELFYKIKNFEYDFYCDDFLTIHNKKTFLTFAMKFKIKYIKDSGKNYYYLISDENYYKYAKGNKIIKKLYNNIR